MSFIYYFILFLYIQRKTAVKLPVYIVSNHRKFIQGQKQVNRITSSLLIQLKLDRENKTQVKILLIDNP